MNTKNILRTLALSLLLVSACSKNEIAYEENADAKGYTLPVTVNVTREGDDATKATFNDDTKILSFSTGDKLFVKGNDYSEGGAGFFAGTLTWQSGGTFSGTILTEHEYSGTIDALFQTTGTLATLLPANYGDYPYLYFIDEGTYSASLTYDTTKTFATSKATAVEQFSFEVGGYTSGTGFALHPANAILNFTITDLAASTEFAVAFKDNTDFTISGNVTTNVSGTATFAIAVDVGTDLKNFILKVGTLTIPLVSSSKEVAAGKIYNITRSAVDPNAPLSGIFSISAGQTVQFSKGNLQYQASTGTWRFAEHQYDYVGNAAGNNTSSERETQSDWIDLFGWGTSGKTFASGYGTAYQPWATSTTSNEYGPTDGTSGLTGTYANGDWGVNMGAGWRTLTSDEWTHLLNSRGGTRYCKATVNSKTGLVIFPDSYSHPTGVDAVESANTTNAAYDSNSWSGEDWTKMEAAGAVFLPAACSRYNNMIFTGSGLYWSSTSYQANTAYGLNFSSTGMNPTGTTTRCNGGSVRLVQEVVGVTP